MPEKSHPLEFMKQALDCRCCKCKFLEGKTGLDSLERFVFLTALVSIHIKEIFRTPGFLTLCKCVGRQEQDHVCMGCGELKEC